MCDSAGIYVLESPDSAGHPQPYSVDSALCSRTGLTDGFAFDPTSRIAYYSDVSGTPGVFAFDLASSKVDVLADDCIPTSHPPALLRKLHLLAFAGQCTRAATSDETMIYFVGVDGSTLRAAGSKAPMLGDQVTWSPDGGQIAYIVASKSGVPSITVSDTTGAGSHRVAEGDAPAWSPDGNWIAYLTKGNGLDSGRTGIRMVHPDGTGDRPVWQSAPSRDLELVSPILWSLDSESLIVSSSNSLWQVTVGDGSSHALVSFAPQRE
jgi:Tol biopolymer transport system component